MRMRLRLQMQAHGDPPPDIVEEMTGLPDGASAAGLGGGLPGMAAGLGGGAEEAVPAGLDELTKDLEQNCKMQ